MEKVGFCLEQAERSVHNGPRNKHVVNKNQILLSIFQINPKWTYSKLIQMVRHKGEDLKL